MSLQSSSRKVTIASKSDISHITTSPAPLHVPTSITTFPMVQFPTILAMIWATFVVLVRMEYPLDVSACFHS